MRQIETHTMKDAQRISVCFHSKDNAAFVAFSRKLKQMASKPFQIVQVALWILRFICPWNSVFTKGEKGIPVPVHPDVEQYS